MDEQFTESSLAVDGAVDEVREVSRLKASVTAFIGALFVCVVLAAAFIGLAGICTLFILIMRSI